MAAEGSVSISSEQIQRLLQCAVCLDRFKQPKLLPCQHTFCLSPCLEGLVEQRTRSIRCPECRADHFVPRAGVASYPNNLTIIGFLSVSETSVSTSEFDNREELRAVLVNSNNRGDNATRREPHAHSEHEGPPDNGGLQAGQQQPLSRDISNNGRGGNNNGGCYVCHSQNMIQRCCHCEHLICEPCHQEHMNLVRAELGRLIGTIRRGLPHVTDQIIAVRRKAVQLQSRCDGVKTEITEGVEKLIRELRTRERNLHEEVDSFLNGEMRGLRNYQENAEVEIASLNSFCDTAECLLGERRRIPTGDLIETKRQSEEHVETVQNYEDGSTRPPNIKQIQLAFETPFISSTISNLGELVITNRATRLMMQRSREDNVTNASANFTPRLSTSDFQEDDFDEGINYDHRARGRMNNGFGVAMQSSPLSPAPSPSFTRRATTQSTRPAQVTFAGEEDDEEEDTIHNAITEGNSRWDTLSHVTRSHRRSRQERVSDTTALNLTSGPPLSRRLADRRRHQSLGALQIDDYDPNEELPSTPDRHYDNASYLQDRLGGSRDYSYSSSFPGTRNYDFDFASSQSQSTRERNSSTRQNFSQDFQNSPSDLSSILNRSTPGRCVDTPRNRYNQKGNAVIEIGTRGSEPGQFIWPRGLAVSHLDDRIYVSDSSNHRVQIFDSSGRFVRSFGGYGQSDGEFDCLAGIAVTNLGQVVISDRYNHRIQVFDRNGRFQHCFGSEGSGNGELNYPWGVTCDNMGFIYVCDKENHRVQVFQSNGTFVRVIGEHGSRIGQLENPHYVAVSQDNKVYVSDSSNHRVQVFSIYGDFLFGFGVQGSLRGQMKFPRGIAVDNQGFAVVADSGNNRIKVFRSDGRFYSMFGNWGSENGQFKGLEGVAIQANGNIVISDRENHRVQVF